MSSRHDRPTDRLMGCRLAPRRTSDEPPDPTVTLSVTPRQSDGPAGAGRVLHSGARDPSSLVERIGSWATHTPRTDPVGGRPGEGNGAESRRAATHGDEAALNDLVGVWVTTSIGRARILRDPYLPRMPRSGAARLWQNLPRLRNPDRFEAWAYRLVVTPATPKRAASDVIAAPPAAGIRRARRCPDTASGIATHTQLDQAFRRLASSTGRWSC